MSHVYTATALCVAALWVDARLRFDAGEARDVARVEAALALYGTTFAMISFARGGLLRRDKLLLALCLVGFTFTAFVGVLRPRIIHN
jgi:hypothetical protein